MLNPAAFPAIARLAWDVTSREKPHPQARRRRCGLPGGAPFSSRPKAATRDLRAAGLAVPFFISSSMSRCGAKAGFVHEYKPEELGARAQVQFLPSIGKSCRVERAVGRGIPSKRTGNGSAR
jgi:hypothetical protein